MLPTLGLTRQKKLAVAGLAALVLILTVGMSSNPGSKRSSASLTVQEQFHDKKARSTGDSSKAKSRATHSDVLLKRIEGLHDKARERAKVKRIFDTDKRVAEVIGQLAYGKHLTMEKREPTPTSLQQEQLRPTADSDSGDGMAAHENFDAEKVFHLFCSCRQEDDVLLLDCYVNAYEELCKLFRLFGSVFSFVTSDVEEKIGILRDYRKSDHAEQYKTIQSMLAYEVSNDVIKKKKNNNGSRTLLRLHRALEFITEFLLKLKESDNQCKFSSVVTKAYDDTLGKHHPWLVRKAVHVAMYMLPTRPDLLKKMGLKDEEKDMNVVMELVKELNLIYSISQELYAKDKLLDLP